MKKIIIALLVMVMLVLSGCTVSDSKTHVEDASQIPITLTDEIKDVLPTQGIC